MTSAVSLRVHQFVEYLRPAPVDVSVPADLLRRLTPESRKVFAQLTPVDQAHLIRVASETSHIARDDDDLIAAALIHDIGKYHERITVRLHDRVAKVLLERWSPRVLARLTAQDTPTRAMGGLWVLGRHAKAGAALARSWGYSERVCWLIEHHETQHTTDMGLQRLIAIDNGASAGDLSA